MFISNVSDEQVFFCFYLGSVLPCYLLLDGIVWYHRKFWEPENLRQLIEFTVCRGPELILTAPFYSTWPPVNLKCHCEMVFQMQLFHFLFFWTFFSLFFIPFPLNLQTPLTDWVIGWSSFEAFLELWHIYRRNWKWLRGWLCDDMFFLFFEIVNQSLFWWPGAGGLVGGLNPPLKLFFLWVPRHWQLHFCHHPHRCPHFDFQRWGLVPL